MMNALQQKSYVLDLSGRWGYCLDAGDEGVADQWFQTGQFPKTGYVQWPGTLTTNEIGEQIDYGLELNTETVRCLRQRHRYIGAAWYERRIEVPADWKGDRVQLFMERVMFQSSVWLNGYRLGSRDSLSSPHCYDVTEALLPGSENVLTVRIDNRDIHHLGQYPSAYTEETQTIWNGAIGQLLLRKLPGVSVEQLNIFPEPELKRAIVKGVLLNALNHNVEARLCMQASPEQHEDRDGTPVETALPPVIDDFVLAAGESKPFEILYPMGDNVLLWDEFNPNCYVLDLALRVGQSDPVLREELIVQERHSFGMRAFRAVGTQLEINGVKTFLRGTLECCIFPMTGHPPMEIEEWNRIFTVAKEYGLNHIRFHSWCPPEQAFAAADRLGIYLQVEGPLWMDTWNTPVGSHPAHHEYLPAEATRIVQWYGNHPSFCLFSNGNELNGDFALLSRIVTDLKAGDARRVYTLTTNWDRPLDQADDLYCAQTADGTGARGQYFPYELIDSTALDFRAAVAKRSVPLVTHEVGQYTVFPDMKEIGRYTGVMDAVNFKAIRADLERRGLLPDAEKFLLGSGMLALQLYRDEIEAALRTPGLGGFQLLDLHDFPGQSTATVGILNSFWESKGLIEPERFRQFCAPTVLLLRMPKRIYKCGEPFDAQIEISHFGTGTLPVLPLTWTIADEDGTTLDRGTLAAPAISQGAGQPLGKLRSDVLSNVSEARQLTVTLEIATAGLFNSWRIWVYPDPVTTLDTASSVTISGCVDDRVKRALEGGGTALIILSDSIPKLAKPGKFMPVFWSPVHFATENPCGVFIDDRHPIFSSFPSRYYAEHQWRDLLDRSYTLDMEPYARGIGPIVQVIPNFYHNRKMANLFEARVGAGRVVVCGIDIRSDLPNRPAAAQLRNSILRYMESEAFLPQAALDMEELTAMLAPEENEAHTRQLGGADLAIGRASVGDSELDGEHTAGKGNDGIGHTFWQAADEQAGHWWQVDLGEARDITGTKVKFLQPGNILYVIQVSADGEDWHVTVNQTGQTSEHQVRTDLFATKARWVRIVYNGLPAGSSAGHYAFEVY
jgi:hypothetical protein